MQLLNFTIIKLTICLILGITIGFFFSIPLTSFLYITLLFLALLFVTYQIAKKQFAKTVWFGVMTLFSMVSIGILTTLIHNPKNHKSHYSHQISSEKDSLKTITFRIREVLKPGDYHEKYVIDVLEIDGKKVTGKSLLNIEKDTIKSPLKVDDMYFTKTNFNNIAGALNPYQFDYKRYLEKKYIYYQLFMENGSLLKMDSKTHTLFGIANNIRTYTNKKINLYNFKPEEISIMNALLLGQRQDISKDVYTSYINAGAIHILAVSGLHVGVFLMILSYIFKPLERFKYGKLIKTIFLVSILWSFALIAGLSASVTRSVTMFSVVAIALNLKRPTNIYNTLAISMFIILLFKPLFLFDVGFQLSYLAVFSIVALDPYLYNLWRPKNRLIDIYWHTFTITVSAQLGIMPISLYYFHQFSGLFFISNLVIIPFLALILGFGILVILLAIFEILPNFIATLYGYIIDWMNGFVGWVSQQEAFIFKDIPFSLLYVLVFYLLTINLVRFLIKRNFSTLKLLLASIMSVQMAVIYTEYSKPSREFIVFHKGGHSLLGNYNNNMLMVADDFKSATKLETNIIKDYSVGNHIKNVERQKFQSVYQLDQKNLLVIDSLGIYNIKSFNPDYVLLRQSPKINLNRLIDSIKPKEIIADGSNYKSYIEQWEIVCNKRKLPFHQTGEKGAFVINY